MRDTGLTRWHYTTGEKLASILNDGVIKRTVAPAGGRQRLLTRRRGRLQITRHD